MRSRKDGATIVAVGAAACAACCAGPIVGVLGAIGLGTVGSVLLFGAAGLLVGAAGLALFLTRRRRRANACSTTSDVVAVELPIPRAR
ncbi:MAG: hypothetical protein JWN62_1953 [Acidimicrobiales bacterium]|nr:hypothetical protein [Acidimicrobiales bacterium]